jgi:hypothetical protein
MGYGKAPWTFKGRAWYQLSLVRADEARRHVPASLPLVELFGWTLGGFYLARYEDSPVGAFDELVALGGLVWDAPVSAAWAARVYVSNPEARRHGLRHVGLPSRLATFLVVEEDEEQEQGTPCLDSGSSSSSSKSSSSWWHPSAPGDRGSKSPPPPRAVVVEVRNAERAGSARALSAPVCRLRLPPVRAGRLAGTLAAPSHASDSDSDDQKQQQRRDDGAPWWQRVRWLDGPAIRLALPSFSGATPDVPGLLKYACALRTNVLPALVAGVEFPGRAGGKEEAETAGERERQGGRGEVIDLVLGGRPLVALCFNDMEMRVEEPVALPQRQQAHEEEGQQRQRRAQQQQGRRGLLWVRRQREGAIVAAAA